MVGFRTLATGIAGGTGGDFHAADGGAILIAEVDGRVGRYDLQTGAYDPFGSGWSEPVDVVIDRGGTDAFVSERTGAVVRIALSSPARVDGEVIADGLRTPHQMQQSDDGSALYVVERDLMGRLLRIDLSDGALTTVAIGLHMAVGLAVDESRGLAYVIEQGATGGPRLARIDLASGTVAPLVGGLVAPFYLTWTDASHQRLMLVEREPLNRLSFVDVLAPTPARCTIATLPARLASVVPTPSAVIACCEQVLIELDFVATAIPEIALTMPTRPLFCGSWERIPIDLNRTGFTLDDLVFEVDAGPELGEVSLGRQVGLDPARQEIVLVAGPRLGRAALVVREAATNAVLATGAFETTTEWPSEVDGPSIAITGEHEPFVSGAAWGGGPAGPQNVDVIPAMGARRVATVLVDTSSARYPSTAASLDPIRTEWRNELMGDTADPDGVIRSVNHYFREVSFNRFDIAHVGNTVFGPFALANDWTAYFQPDANGNWQFKGNLPQAAVTAAQDEVDFSQVDSLVIIVNTVPAAGITPVRFAWPYASGATVTFMPPGAAMPQMRTIGIVVMPFDWDVQDGRRIHETLSHEIGHNIGLPDLYMSSGGFGPEIADRDVNNFDIMSADGRLAHLSLAHRMMLGWVRPEWIRPYNFALAGGGVDDTITLQAAETIGFGGPPAGRFAGIEVRRADGWNYYFEYRAEQSGQIGDQTLDVDRCLFGSDVVSGGVPVPLTRRSIIEIMNDVDGDGPILRPGDDYEEFDTSGPAQFQIDVVSTAADSAQIRVRYGAGGRPDPQIRPWPGGNVYQSPDIEVRNARNAADTAWANVPWAGNDNTVVAKIRNGGDFPAPQVRALFSVRDYGINGPEMNLPSDSQDIPAGNTVEFTTSWRPPANTPTNDAHFCIKVQIPLYQDPGNPAIVELTEVNNFAQSNYTRFISATASPATRGVSSIAVSNPYEERTRFFVFAQQDSSYYRTFLGHRWLWLDPGETRHVPFLYESLSGDPLHGQRIEHELERVWGVPARVSVVGTIEDPHDRQLHTGQVAGGAELQLGTGRATRILIGDTSLDVVSGRVVLESDGTPVNQGRMLLAIRLDASPDKIFYREGDVAQGSFFVPVDPQEFLGAGPLARVQAHYLGAFSYAPSDSETFEIDLL